jgi:hypothetical protein
VDFARRKLLGLLSATWVAQACYAVVKVGAIDQLAGGPRTAAELAAATGAHPRVLHRLLRALAAAGVLKQTAGSTYELTSVGELLRSDAEGSGALMALMHGEEVFRAFADIMHTVDTGEPAFVKTFGMPFYAYLDAHPEAATTFNVSMGDKGAPAGLRDCDLGGITHLMDVGGGNGALLADVLAAHPGMRGTLVERPPAIRAAKERLADGGVGDRVALVEGDFFESVPAGADGYVLARVLHNWNDEHARDVLHRVHATMAPGARLFVLEEILPDDIGATPPAGLVDLLMLVTQEGFDRTESEYRELLVACGFTVTAVHHGASVAAGGAIEAIKAAPQVAHIA